uniref:Uncharacterized protein n=1 Tax=Romanomermis culicivorax TaxID=13658 RepID=A0A915KUV0_ROMCU
MYGRTSDWRNDVAGLLKKRKAAGNLSMSFDMSSAHMAETFIEKMKGDTPREDGGLGGDVTLTSAFCQLDRARIAR